MLLFQGKVCPELGTTLPKLVLLVWKYVMKDFKIRPGSALDNLTWLTYSGLPVPLVYDALLVL